MFDTTILKSSGLDRVPDQVLHLGHVLVGDLDARSGGRLDVDGELAGVGPRKKRQAQKRIDRQTEHETRQRARPRSGRDAQGPAHPVFIDIQDLVESAVESAVEPAPQTEPPVRRPRVRAAHDRAECFQKPRAEQRNHRHRDHERRQQRNAECQGQRGEQKLTHAVQKASPERNPPRPPAWPPARPDSLPLRPLRRPSPATRPFQDAGKCFPAR